MKIHCIGFAVVECHGEAYCSLLRAEFHAPSDQESYHKGLSILNLCQKDLTQNRVREAFKFHIHTKRLLSVNLLVSPKLRILEILKNHPNDPNFQNETPTQKQIRTWFWICAQFARICAHFAQICARFALRFPYVFHVTLRFPYVLFWFLCVCFCASWFQYVFLSYNHRFLQTHLFFAIEPSIRSLYPTTCPIIAAMVL